MAIIFDVILGKLREGFERVALGIGKFYLSIKQHTDGVDGILLGNKRQNVVLQPVDDLSSCNFSNGNPNVGISIENNLATNYEAVRIQAQNTVCLIPNNSEVRIVGGLHLAQNSDRVTVGDYKFVLEPKDNNIELKLYTFSRDEEWQEVATFTI